MFLQPCFLRNADKELFAKLSILGYIPSYHSYDLSFAGKNLVCEFGTWHFTDSDNHPDYIDCGENVQLFLSIAALRDDTDVTQWFTDGIHWEVYKNDNKLDDNMIRLWKNYYGEEYVPHKATVNELIEKFKI